MPAMSMPRRIVIVGGGLSGLTCARAIAIGAAKAGNRVEVVVLEAGARFGGIIATEQKDEFVMDHGPDGWVTNKPEATALATELGLDDEVIPTIEKNRRVYLVHEGRLHPMPEGLVLGIPTRISPIVKTAIFSLRAKARMAFEPLVPRGNFEGDADESIGHFIERRLGHEVADRLVGPLLGGIFAGDAGSISVRAAFPQLVAAEKKFGSLLLAMREQKRSVKSPSMFASLRGGMGRLIEALIRDLEKRDDVTLKTGASVRKVTRVEGAADSNGARNTGSFVIELASGTVERADVIVVATPVPAAAGVLRSLEGGAAEAIDAMMGTVSSATVFFGFDRTSIKHALDASGFIVPRSEGEQLLASTWVSSKWVQRAPEGRVLLRGFVGGAGHEKILENDDDALSAFALLELRKLMPISGSPLFSRVFRFDNASPQLNVGHLVRARRLRENLEKMPNVFVIGNGYEGVGMPACIKHASETANAIVGGSSQNSAGSA